MGRLTTCGRHRGPSLLDDLGRRRGRGKGCLSVPLLVAFVLVCLWVGAP